jgi:hypothetical protein
MTNTDKQDQTDDATEANYDADREPIEKLGRVIKEVSEKLGCKANVVLENFAKRD